MDVLISRGHIYADIIDEYSFMRFMRFYLLAKKAQLHQQRNEIVAGASAIGMSFSKDKNAFKNYKKEIDQEDKRVDEMIRGISGVIEENKPNTKSFSSLVSEERNIAKGERPKAVS